MKFADNLPIIEWVDLKTIRDPRKVLLITSPSVAGLVDIYLNGINVVEKVFIESAEKKYAKKLANKSSEAEVCYAFGGGRVNDIGRYIASRKNLEIICIPTIISTDAFLVDCTGLRENNGVEYVPSKKAEKVILDYSLLKEADDRFNLSGCGDVLSIYTALYDWKKSKDNYVRGVASVAQGILDGLMSETRAIKNMSRLGFEILVTNLAMEVQLCYLYGNSRPEEGGEHFFVYCLENKLRHTLHGELVCFGILITAFLQGQSYISIKDFMDTVGIRYIPEEITRSVILETLSEISDYVKTHNLPVSIYNNFAFEKNKKDIDSFLNSLQIR